MDWGTRPGSAEGAMLAARGQASTSARLEDTGTRRDIMI